MWFQSLNCASVSLAGPMGGTSDCCPLHGPHSVTLCNSLRAQYGLRPSPPPFTATAGLPGPGKCSTFPGPLMWPRCEQAQCCSDLVTLDALVLLWETTGYYSVPGGREPRTQTAGPPDRHRKVATPASWFGDTSPCGVCSGAKTTAPHFDLR